MARQTAAALASRAPFVGKQNSKSSGRCSVPAAMARVTPIWHLELFPADPVHCRWTPTELGAPLVEARVVEDPGRHALTLLDVFDGATSRFQSNGTVVQTTAPKKM